MNNDSPNDWLKFWSENQKTLFQAWVEGKPPPGAFRGEPPPMGVTVLMPLAVVVPSTSALS